MRMVNLGMAPLFMIMLFVVTGVGGAKAESVLPRHSFELGNETSYIKYKEPGIMEETGVMSGIVGSYTYHDSIMLKAEGKYSYGQVDYDGQLTDGTPYEISKIDDNMLEFRALAGYDIALSERSFLTPYIGFGYRYLNDDSSFNAAGYERESNYYYSPIGIEALASFDNGWSVGGTVEFDYFWKGVQKSHLGDFLVGLNTLENHQDEGYGLRGSIRVQRKMDRHELVVEPYVKYWNIKASDTDTVTYFGAPIGVEGYEPKNNSTEIGVKLAVRF